MFRCNLKKAQIENANLSGSILTYAILSEANLQGLNLADAVLSNLIISDQHWLKRLDDWKVNGAPEIQRKYKMIEAYSYENSKYQLIKRGN
ncbi:MAG TPA: pentapeptide repeat-containing protein, partial [Saprospiraceae bacterium]|nr:pentapeptide repeat-containing protein [Saprospiraceae bacterium]